MNLKKHAPFNRVFMFGPLALMAAACNPIQSFQKEIKALKYIPYPTPLEYAGTGTLVGGAPDQLSLVSAPSTCFADSGGMRKLDKTVLGDRQYQFSVAGNISLGFLTMLMNGNSLLKAGLSFSTLQGYSLQMRDVEVEYLDSVEVTRHYRSGKMDELCKDYLDHVGFIIQALRVGKMRFEFYNKSGVKLDLSDGIPLEYITIGGGVEWQVIDNYILEITTPKYIGYQMGQLRRSDNGMVLRRAVKTSGSKYVFEDLTTFPEDKSNRRGQSVFEMKSQGLLPAGFKPLQ